MPRAATMIESVMAVLVGAVVDIVGVIVVGSAVSRQRRAP